MQDSVKLGEDSRQRIASVGDNTGIRNSWKCFNFLNWAGSKLMFNHYNLNIYFVYYFVCMKIS